MKQILSIQYLRGLAALSVVAFHLCVNTTHPFPAGAAGVDIFFVISGFIMFIVAGEREKDPRIFFWRRLIRIVPLYWCVTALAVAVTAHWPRLLWNADISYPHVLASLFFIPHIPHVPLTAGDDITPTFSQGWSLNYEMFFYVLMALSMFLPKRLRLPGLSALLLFLAATGACVQPRSAIPRVYTDPMMAEFAAGLWLGQFWVWKALPGRKTGILLLAVGVFCFCLEQALNIRIEALRPNIPSVLVVLGALSIEADGGIFSVQPLKLLGDASYSIYLLHPLIVSAVVLLDLPYLLALFTGVAVSILAGLFTFFWFERPVRRALEKPPRWYFGRSS